jgi:uncharacterized protein (TIGR02246 family)
MGGATSARTGKIWQTFAFAALAVAVISEGLVAGPSSGLAETASACVKPSDVETVQLLNRWRAEFTSGSPDRIAALYAADATLVPSKDGNVRKGRDAIRAYYQEFLARRPALSIKPASLSSGCGTASVSGPAVYRIKGERKGTRLLLGGRYTAEFALRDGAWLIVQHALAADPRGIGDAFDASAANP